MRSWSGRENFKSLSKEDALEKYRNVVVSLGSGGIIGRMGRKVLIDLMKEELVNHFGILEEELD